MISQAELGELCEAQDNVWTASRVAHHLAFDIEERIKAGAAVEAGELEFSPEMRRAHWKRSKTG